MGGVRNEDTTPLTLFARTTMFAVEFKDSDTVVSLAVTENPDDVLRDKNLAFDAVLLER